MANQSYKEGLNKLSSMDISQDYYDLYWKEANSEVSDRGAAILISSNLENILQHAIQVQLGLNGKRKDLFGSSGPMGTFAFKIKIAHAIRIIGNQTAANLDIIREIRNVFAHAKIPVRFTATAIQAACALLEIPPVLPPVARSADWKPETEEDQQAIQGRDRFVRVCDDTAHNLFVRSFAAPEHIMADSIPTRMGEYFVGHRDVWAFPKPLP